ncbi:MAG: hypothetical protein H6937_11850 [Burkholderiales bacterium]|nr:hypothetical protein [Burkholderiales bacterium]
MLEETGPVFYVCRQWRRSPNKIKELNREIVMFASGHLIDELKNKYHYHDVILSLPGSGAAGCYQ